jgi:hypothetical protein
LKKLPRRIPYEVGGGDLEEPSSFGEEGSPGIGEELLIRYFKILGKKVKV